jgi:hypothetical protein
MVVNVGGQIACGVCRTDQIGRMRIAGVRNADLGKLGIVHYGQVDRAGNVIFSILVRRARIDHQRVGRELFDAQRFGVGDGPASGFSAAAWLSRLGSGIHRLIIRKSVAMASS